MNFVVLYMKFFDQDYPGFKSWVRHWKGGASSVEDEVIFLLPNMPGGNDEDLHEEGVSKLSLTERAAKEQVESCLFNVVIA